MYIAAPAEQVWNALIDGKMTQQYVYGTRLESTLQKGSPYAYVGDGDFKVVDGQTATYKGSVASWPLTLSSLKSLLETGKPLAVK